ncbi:MAG: acyl-CoA dehydrogenase family protein, partial [Saprospiraceae bacterium]|nr:acyl-CoA dehydrogenase family protein [Saprospiraceae bacterium]
MEKVIHRSNKSDLFKNHDYFGIDDLLTEEHKMIRDSVRTWVSKEVLPIIESCAEQNECPLHLYKQMGELGALGPSISAEYGGGGMDEITYGIIMQELERGDSGIRSMASVQGSLVMFPISKYGTEKQKSDYLPKLASGEIIGCFGLTEPDHGSNPGEMVTNIKDDGDAYILNGAKMWITNSPIADIAVVWAKDETNRIRGMVIEKGMKGFSAPKIEGKWSLRASITGELVFEDVRV